MSQNLFTKIASLLENVTRLSSILEGDKATTVTLESGQRKPSISKAIQDQFADLRGMVSGQRVAYKTQALLFGDLQPGHNALGEVTNDPDPAKNGVYIKEGVSGVGSWTLSNYDRFADMDNRASLGRYQLLGFIKTFDVANLGEQGTGANPGDTATVTLSWDRLYLYSGTDVKFVAAGSFTVASTEALYLDLNQTPNGSGEYVVAKTDAATEEFWDVTADFTRDNQVLIFGQYNGRFTGLLPVSATLHDVKAKDDRIHQRVTNRVTDLMVPMVGASFTVTKGASNSLDVVLPACALFRGAEAYKPIAVNGGTFNIPLNQALYVDIDEDITNRDALAAAVTSSAFYSAAENTASGFMGNNRICLLANTTGNKVSGLLAPHVHAQYNRADPWLGHVVMKDAGVTVNFDAATRTLSWDGVIYFQFAEGKRVKLGAGSVTFGTGVLQVAWLDMRELVFAETPATAVKVGTYFTGTDRFVSDAHQVPLFYYSAGDYGCIGGFPAPEQALVVDYDPDDIVCMQTADYLDFFVKGVGSASTKYIKYRFQYHVDAAKSYEGWRMNGAWLVSRTGEYSFTALQQVVNAGEWECAVRETGKPDYMGGLIHGVEQASRNIMLVDGVKQAWGQVRNFTCRSLDFIQQSKLTEYAASADRANKWTRWHITAQAMTLDHRLEWLADVSLQTAYLGMLPIMRKDSAYQVTEAGARSPYYVEEAMSSEGFTEVIDASGRALIWGNDVQAEVEVVKGWQWPNRNFRFSNATQYNKLYFDLTGAGYAVTTGDVWEVSTIYRIRATS